MNKLHTYVSTVRGPGGWQIVVVGGNFLRVGARMAYSGIFLDTNTAIPRTFPTRSAARTELRRYMKQNDYVKVTGGLH